MNFRLSRLSTLLSKQGGFTLIELLLGITLSAILMTGIVIFVSSSLGSNMAIKKTLKDGSKNEEFEQKLTEVF
jgi:prepilin-type N-terminal cleavage/methylation domain-containing protein